MLRGGNPEKHFAEALVETVRDSQDILDIGTSQRFAKELRPYEGLFKGKRYIAAGYQPSSAYGAYNCDCHQDIQNMTFADASFDAVLMHRSPRTCDRSLRYRPRTCARPGGPMVGCF